MEEKKPKIESEVLIRQMEFILGITKTGLDIIDSDYNIRYIDPAWKKIYGDPAGKKCYEYFMGKREPCSDCGVPKALKTKKTVITEEYLIKEGNRPIQITTIPFQDEKGEWLVAEVKVDIAEQKKIEKELIKYREHLEELVKERTEEIRKSEERFRAIFDNANEGMVLVEPETKRFYAYNKIVCQIFGYTEEEFKELTIIDLHTKEDLPRALEEFRRSERKETTLITNMPFKRKNGSIVYVDISGSLITLAGKRYMLGIFNDITSRKQTEDMLFSTNQTLQDIINFLPDATFVVDKDKRVISWNRAIEGMTGVRQIDILGKGNYIYATPFYGKPRPMLIDILQKPDKKIERKYDFITRRGHIIYGEVFLPHMYGGRGAYVWGIASPLFDIKGDIAGAIESIRDITDRKRAEEKLKALNKEITRTNESLKQLSLRDSHTGLYNHRYFMEVIEVEFERARRNGQPLSMMMLDIDYFKSINDVYGHQFGDLVLKQFAKQLKLLVRRYDIIIRYGGEEFIIISPGTKRADALNLARRVLDSLNLYNFGDKKHTVKLKLSIAAASYPDDNVINGMGLMGLTDQILNEVKEAGGNRIYSSLDMDKEKAPSLKESTDVRFMEGKIDKLTKRANQSLVEAIFAFAKTIELKDRYTGEHGERTVQFATNIARELKLSKYDIELIRQAAILHDLGKIGISEKILLKKGKLTKKEFDEIKKHPQIAVDILRPIQFLHPLIPLILHHHERWDGKGYPHGLKGERIPMGARVLALADHYQALISDRPYRKAFPQKEAVKIIKKGTGTQFCPRVVAAFLKILKKKK